MLNKQILVVRINCFIVRTFSRKIQKQLLQRRNCLTPILNSYLSDKPRCQTVKWYLLYSLFARFWHFQDTEQKYSWIALYRRRLPDHWCCNILCYLGTIWCTNDCGHTITVYLLNRYLITCFFNYVVQYWVHCFTNCGAIYAHIFSYAALKYSMTYKS